MRGQCEMLCSHPPPHSSLTHAHPSSGRQVSGFPLGGLQLSNGKSLSHLTNTVGREFDKLAVHCIMCHMYGDWRRRIVARSVARMVELHIRA